MKIRRELWFGFSLMALIVVAALYMLVSVPKIESGHIGLLMLSLVVVAIMLGFPTAFTLMGMGMIFTWLAYNRDTTKTNFRLPDLASFHGKAGGLAEALQEFLTL